MSTRSLSISLKGRSSTPDISLGSNSLYFTIGLPVIRTNLDVESGNFSAALKLPAIMLNASVVAGGRIGAALALPTIRLAAALSSGGGLSASLRLPAIALSLVIAPQAVINAALQLPAIELAGSIIIGGVFSAAINIPVIVLAAMLDQRAELSLALSIPSLKLWLDAVVIPPTPIRKGFVMNLSHFGVTEYENYPFNSVCDYHGTGLYIGASEKGIFLLDGEDDAGIGIDAVIATGTEDLWAVVMKRLREGWVTMRGGPMVLEIVLDQGRLPSIFLDSQTFQDIVHEERIKLPRGLKNRFDSFIWHNVEGSDFDFESLRIFVDSIQRRKR